MKMGTEFRGGDRPDLTVKEAVRFIEWKRERFRRNRKRRLRRSDQTE